MRKICILDGCDKYRQGQGYCTSHYTRFRKYGDPLGGLPGRLSTAIESFNYYVIMAQQDDDCWGWRGSFCGRHPHNYGVFSTQKIKYKAHRFSYTEYVGEIPDGYEVCHTCDNTLCSNPKHLFIGTHADNMQDMKEKGRRKNINIGDKNGRALLTLDQAITIKESYTGRRGEIIELASLFDVDVQVIGRLLRGNTWKQLG